MMSNNTDQKVPHVSIPIAPSTTSTDTTPTIHSTKTFQPHHHPENDSNTVQDPSSTTTTTTGPLPAVPQALHLNTSHTAGGGIISNSAGRHRHSSSSSSSSAFQDVDIATLRASSSEGGTMSDPLTDSTFFNTARRHSSASTGGFVLESPTMSSTPYEFELQRFNAYDGSEPSTVKVVTTIFPAPSSKPTTTTTTTTTTPTGGNSFFTGWMAVPPSLAGRPKLSQDQEDYIRREYERGPVPLMWAKKDDLENQTASATTATEATPATTTTAAAAAVATSSSWFGNWGFRSSFASSTAGTDASIMTPPRTAVAPTPSDSGRRETSQAL
ncbi:hypothetical protein EC957_002272 [Mortierella hygrophila]|uniref:Uncharacterized protein n=1 Tax=Mortierella hygrophila TaxID=979708 RepID=A0A9P6F4T8_9FUNG|nr:hypothetical protein EC957_002272 [Mortierella hygrophila]